MHKPRIFIFPRRRSTIVCFVYKISMNGDDYLYDKLFKNRDLNTHEMMKPILNLNIVQYIQCLKFNF